MHLTTRQYPAHRRLIIAEINRRLKAGEACRLVATSLIEAGVDLDFPKGWRAEAGLDSVIQAAGRVNREGKRSVTDSTLTVFSPLDDSPPSEVKKLAKAMRNTAKKFGADVLLEPEAIRDWFDEVYWRAGEKLLDKAGILGKFLFSRRSGTLDFAYRSVAEAYRMVEDTMVPVIIEREELRIVGVRGVGVVSSPSAV